MNLVNWNVKLIRTKVIARIYYHMNLKEWCSEQDGQYSGKSCLLDAYVIEENGDITVFGDQFDMTISPKSSLDLSEDGLSSDIIDLESTF